ncbi:MAG: 16S rRNA (uracil(1498)-N(3))-methyltransferase [Bacteroidia bacterium]|nr:16S rRNA (uracil(1498)-N(3))-methyltransferase [Bacteroidia bacterium]
MQTFFCAILNDTSAQLKEEETRHLKVLRVKEYDVIRCVDGLGGVFDCKVLKIGKDYTDLEVLTFERFERSKNFYLHLYLAPTKNAERIEWFLEKAVETGIDAITFIDTEHAEKHRVNFQRLERIAISALKQSGQLFLPLLNPITPLNQVSPKGTILFAHCEIGQKQGLVDYFNSNKLQGDIHVFIGPEGDFSKIEIQKMYASGYAAISLGNSRLRTETAALYTVMVINALSPILPSS